MRGEHWKTAGMLLAIAGMLLVGMAVQRARMRAGQAPDYSRSVR